MKHTGLNGVIINSWKKHLALPWMRPITHEDHLRAASGNKVVNITHKKYTNVSTAG